MGTIRNPGSGLLGRLPSLPKAHAGTTAPPRPATSSALSALPPIGGHHEKLPADLTKNVPKPDGFLDPLEDSKAPTPLEASKAPTPSPQKPVVGTPPFPPPPIQHLPPGILSPLVGLTNRSGPIADARELNKFNVLGKGPVFNLPTAGTIQNHPYRGTSLETHFSDKFKFDSSQLKGPDPVGSVKQWSANLSSTMNGILTVNKAETKEYKELMTQVLVVDNGSIYLKGADGNASGKPLGTLESENLRLIWDKSDSNYNTGPHQTVRNNVYKQVSDVARHSMRFAVHVVVEEAESLRDDFGKMMADQSKLDDAKSALDKDIETHLAKGVMVDNFAERTNEISDLQAQVSAKYAQSEAQLKALGSLITEAKNFETKVKEFSKGVDEIKGEATTFNDEAAAHTRKLTKWATEIDTQKEAFSKQKDAFVESNQAFNVTLSLREFTPQTPGSSLPKASSPSSSPARETTFSSTREITKSIADAAKDGYDIATSHKRGIAPAGLSAEILSESVIPKTPQEIKTMALLAVAQHPAMIAFDTRYTLLSDTLTDLNSQIKSGLDDLGKQYKQLQPTQLDLTTRRDDLASQRGTLSADMLNFNTKRTELEAGLAGLRASMEALEKALLKPNSGEADVTIKSTLESRNVEISDLNLKIESFKKMSDEFKEKHPSLGNLSCLPAAVNTMVDRINVVIQAYSGIGGVRSDVEREGSDLVPEVKAFPGQAGGIEPPGALPLFNIPSTVSLTPVPFELLEADLPNAQFSISPLVAPKGEAVDKPIVVPVFDIVAAEFNAKVKLNLLDSTTFTMNGVFSAHTNKLARADQDHSLNTPKKREAAIREGLSTTVTTPDSGRLATLLSDMNDLRKYGIAFNADGKDVITTATLLDHYKNQIGIRIEKGEGIAVTVTVVSAVGMDAYLKDMERKIDKLKAGIKNLEAEKKAVTDASQLISKAVRLMYSGDPCPADMAATLSPSLKGAPATGLTGKLINWASLPSK